MVPKVSMLDDNPGDVQLVEAAFADARIAVAFTGDTDSATFLTRLASSGTGGIPHVIIVDWTLPGSSGARAIAAIRAMPPLAKVPIVVFSGTCSPEDHAAGLQAGATEIARKPGSYREYLDFVRRLSRFWASSQRLPRPVAMIGGAPSGS